MVAFKQIGQKLSLTGSFDAQCVPHVDVEVVVTGHEESAGFGESDGGDATNDVVVRVLSQFLKRQRQAVKLSSGG